MSNHSLACGSITQTSNVRRIHASTTCDVTSFICQRFHTCYLPAHTLVALQIEMGTHAEGGAVCWICLCGSEEGKLTQACTCPQLQSHAVCLARW